jgi:hypothetical protein
MFLALAAMAQVAAGCSQAMDDAPLLCPTGLAAVRSLVVEKVAQRAWLEKVQPPNCEAFAPDAAVMRRYLAQARRTDAGAVHHVLAESPCQASGRVRFADGRRAQWSVDQLGVGKLRFADGSTLLLFAPDFSVAPFVPQ